MHVWVPQGGDVECSQEGGWCSLKEVVKSITRKEEEQWG